MISPIPLSSEAPIGLQETSKVDGSEATFYADKDLIVPVLTMIAPILKPMVPENYQQMVDMVLQLLPNAKTLEFGLNNLLNQPKAS